MQQLSFLDPPSPKNAAPPVWDALDEEQRTTLVNKLARLIAQTVVQNSGETYERAE